MKRTFLAFLILVTFGVASAELGAYLQRDSAKHMTTFWFRMFLWADAARVECEYAQPIIFPRDTAQSEI